SSFPASSALSSVESSAIFAPDSKRTVAPGRRKVWGLLLVLLIVAGSGFAIWKMTTTTPTTDPTIIGKPGGHDGRPVKVAIRSTPDRVQFTIADAQGKTVTEGTTPLDVELIPGKYRWEATRSDYRRGSQDFAVESSQSRTVEIILEKMDGPPADF